MYVSTNKALNDRSRSNLEVISKTLTELWPFVDLVFG